MRGVIQTQLHHSKVLSMNKHSYTAEVQHWPIFYLSCTLASPRALVAGTCLCAVGWAGASET